MKHKELILATDLDGTFLEGSYEERTQFYQFLSKERDRIGVVFVTGRTLGLIRNLYQGGLDFIPDYIIADHGTVMVKGENFEYVEDVQSEIIEKWNAAKHDELKALLRTQAVQEQPFYLPFRHAYYYQKGVFDESVVLEIQSLGFECILSHGVYLDILPATVGKGTTLGRLIDFMGCHDDRVVTCGDSMNDLPMFEMGYKSIAVGNSEPELLGHIEKMDHMFLSEYPGVSGIVNGLKFYQMLCSDACLC